MTSIACPVIRPKSVKDFVSSLLCRHLLFMLVSSPIVHVCVVIAADKSMMLCRHNA